MISASSLGLSSQSCRYLSTMEPVDDQTIALEASDPLLQLSELQQQLVTNASDLSRRPSFAT